MKVPKNAIWSTLVPFLALCANKSPNHPSGFCCNTPRRDWRDFGQHQSGLPRFELGLVLTDWRKNARFGGKNISPREIEEFFCAHEKIEDIQAIGVPDSKLGEAVMASIKPKSGISLSEKALRKYLKECIANCKVPKYRKFAERFPIAITGKIRKGETREIFISELGLEELSKLLPRNLICQK